MLILRSVPVILIFQWSPTVRIHAKIKNSFSQIWVDCCQEETEPNVNAFVNFGVLNLYWLWNLWTFCLPGTLHLCSIHLQLVKAWLHNCACSMPPLLLLPWWWPRAQTSHDMGNEKYLMGFKCMPIQAWVENLRVQGHARASKHEEEVNCVISTECGQPNFVNSTEF